ncbi:MAG: helix-turn-helix transcriptional regulator [Bacteroidota bacterium]
MDVIKLNRIKNVLRERGVKQTWLADKLGITTVIVSMWCNNKSQPSLSKLSKIAKLLNIDMRELVEPSLIQKENTDDVILNENSIKRENE